MLAEWHGGQNNGPPSPHFSPRSCECVTLHGKMADVVKLRILSGEMILDYLRGPSVITGVLIRGRLEGPSQSSGRRRDNGSRGQRHTGGCYTAVFEDGGTGHEPTSAGAF